ncbi:hypothetical protein REJC140_03024 [Pseudorhizobium endolithicum]|uniref:Uncharacterized protein n=1 Tax=Pseudorhizobium endolithicum TaxID=1191678 RepID=A0ABN7JJC7_9HYPH|nr:hypothetical protein REJC140_03024 [Pseudorhizobium endolithicum]
MDFEYGGTVFMSAYINDSEYIYPFPEVISPIDGHLVNCHHQQILTLC